LAPKPLPNHHLFIAFSIFDLANNLLPPLSLPSAFPRLARKNAEPRCHKNETKKLTKVNDWSIDRD